MRRLHPPPTCLTSSYSVRANDTCVTISAANEVSTYNLISENALDVACNGISEGKTLCLPETCTTYQLELADTCDSLVSDLNIKFAQLLAWNPNINTGCSNLASWRGWYLCASSPTGTAIVSEGSSATTAVAVPTDAQSLSNTNCAEWHEVLSGEDCSTISLKYAISLSDFYFLNPQIDSNCTNIWLDTSYCVEAVGNIATYTGYITTTAAYTFTKPASTTYTPTPAATATLEPTASGTIEGCAIYNNAFSSTIANATTLNSCNIWASIAEVTVDNLLSWNPSLSASDCTFTSGCFQLHDVFVSFNFSVTTVTSLNPWIGSDCDTGVWNALSSDGFEQICVERNSSAVPTSTTSTISAPTSTISTIVTPPAEVMSDEASNCNNGILWCRAMVAKPLLIKMPSY
ncbi:uncharacterized protein N7518_002145 [Penicillium psychrosexuale]|uniref:uncharacterized protein n=1 Tax=Penicillium psychrosexuale TaxID=1002107 RepID=UPI00254596D7|nr:uncharacterized protein N7518_002145 [Penicillium psychrosexuale]KAJ5800077.1 hypothetical protein N7518_002145 [Penicillium psychrosexuale]